MQNLTSTSQPRPTRRQQIMAQSLRSGFIWGSLSGAGYGAGMLLFDAAENSLKAGAGLSINLLAAGAGGLVGGVFGLIIGCVLGIVGGFLLTGLIPMQRGTRSNFQPTPRIIALISVSLAALGEIILLMNLGPDSIGPLGPPTSYWFVIKLIPYVLVLVAIWRSVVKIAQQTTENEQALNSA